jgi:hypothetical protein
MVSARLFAAHAGDEASYSSDAAEGHASAAESAPASTLSILWRGKCLLQKAPDDRDFAPSHCPCGLPIELCPWFQWSEL